MLYQYGYHPWEVGLKPETVRADLKFVVNTFDDKNPPMRVSPPNFPHIKGVTSWTPNLRNVPGSMLGFGKRVARAIPVPDDGLQMQFFDYVKNVLIPQFPILPEDTDISVESWLTPDNTPTYTESRRQELRDLYHQNGIGPLSKRDVKCKSFIKEETYPEPKHYRTINSRSDQAKITFGPLLKPVEKEVFKKPQFIKYIPVPQRPRYITELLYRPGAKYLVSDYTAYESHFTARVIEHVEYALYEHMLQKVTGAGPLLAELKRALCGTNYCRFKHFTGVVSATRMSGEMCTSLGNGFTNWALMSFAAEYHNTEVSGVVEGDDGLFTFKNNIIPDEAFFARLGFTVKLETVPSLAEAGFCGMYFDPNDKIVVADPIEPLANFGWFPTKYIKAKTSRYLELLRAKSYSLAYQYAGCPVLQSLGQYGLRMTKHIDLRRYLNKDRNISGWEKEQLLEALGAKIVAVEVPMNTRLLVEKQFGITVRQQLDIEAYLDGLTMLQPLDLPQLYDIMPHGYKVCWSHYVVYNEAECQDLGLKRYGYELDIYAEIIDFTRLAQRNSVDRRLLS
jgi:hypothetical protein